MCAREFPELEDVRDRYEEKGVGFLALSLEQDQPIVLEAARKMDIGLKVAVAQTEVLAPFAVTQVPSTVFIDEKGVIVAAASGPRDRAFFERRVKELLGQ